MRGLTGIAGTGLVLLLVAMSFGGAHGASVTLPVTQVWQHKDTNMVCTIEGVGVTHTWNHAVVPAPGCAHCGYYCAPASISVYALYRGRVGAQTQQDDIYDQGKFLGGEILGDGSVQTEGLGMWDTATSPEVQNSFAFAVATPVQWGPGGSPNPPMTNQLVIDCIDDNIPILWCDHGGYPEEMYPPPDLETVENSGHAKIIAGYDDKGTADFADDEYQIYDPWPNAASPYWVASGVVLDAADVFLADSLPVAVETSSWGKVKSLYR